MLTPTLLFRLSARLTPPARTFVHHLHVDLDTASLAAIAQAPMTLASFDKTGASPSPTHALAWLPPPRHARPHPPRPRSCRLFCVPPPVYQSLVNLRLLSINSGEAEDAGACARVSLDKARRTLTLPLARALTTPLSLLKRAKADDELDTLLQSIPATSRAERDAAGEEELAERGYSALSSMTGSMQQKHVAVLLLQDMHKQGSLGQPKWSVLGASRGANGS